jgi:hypothetical protein
MYTRAQGRMSARAVRVLPRLAERRLDISTVWINDRGFPTEREGARERGSEGASNKGGLATGDFALSRFI